MLFTFAGKIKQSKSDEFFRDFDLYAAPHGSGQASTVGYQLPDIFQKNGAENNSNFVSKMSKKTSGVDEKFDASEKRVLEVTKHLATIYRNKRMLVFHNLAQTRTASKSKEFFRIYLSPLGSVLSKKPRLSKLHAQFKKPKKPFCYQMEYEKLRGLRESEEELAKVQAYIDKMVAKNIKKFQEEKKKQQAAVEKVEYHYPTLQELVSCFKH